MGSAGHLYVTHGEDSAGWHLGLGPGTEGLGLAQQPVGCLPARLPGTHDTPALLVTPGALLACKRACPTDDPGLLRTQIKGAGWLADDQTGEVGKCKV